MALIETVEILTTSRKGEVGRVLSIDSDDVAEVLFADGTVGYFDSPEYEIA